MTSKQLSGANSRTFLRVSEHPANHRQLARRHSTCRAAVALALGGILPWTVSAALAAPMSSLTPVTPALVKPVPMKPSSVKPISRPQTMAMQAGPAYPVSSVEVGYAFPSAGQPPIGCILSAPITLAETPTGYVSAFTVGTGGSRVPADGVKTITIPLGQLSAKKARPFHASAIESIERQIVSYINKNYGLMGVYVAVSPADMQGGKDIRKHSDTTLHLVIHTAIVAHVSTVATGDRFTWGDPLGMEFRQWGWAPSGATRSVNNAAVSFIPADSPVQAKGSTAPGSTNLLTTNALNDYLYRLDRQPGRQVGVTITPHAAIPDSVNLNYLVHEEKPWRVYAQLSNTGTEATDPWREQFGFINNQLTGHDDIFGINYSTAGFSKENAVSVSYDFPVLFLKSRRVRARVYADYEGFSASDVGFANANFNGDSTDVGGELDVNIFQWHQLFVDMIGGLKYQHIRVDNTLIGQTGTGDFIMPYIGLHSDYYTQTTQCSANLTLLGNVTDTPTSSLNNLGRLDVTRDWVLLQGNVSSAIYLEPLLNRARYEAGQSTLANQMIFRVSGQEAFNSRLIAEDQMVAGGYYTVRGYPESAVAGDSVGVETLEYALHVPRLFPVEATPGRLFNQPFRYAPQQPYANPDWDLILKSFIDFGEVMNSNRQSYESDSTLIGTGLGVELDLKQNISLVADWGIALTPINGGGVGNQVSAGSSEFNFVFTFSY